MILEEIFVSCVAYSGSHTHALLGPKVIGEQYGWETSTWGVTNVSSNPSNIIAFFYEDRDGSESASIQ